MDDLISRQAALDALDWKWAGKAAIDAIKDLPTIDAIPVVRCKDCKWCGLSEYTALNIHICKKFSGVREMDDYCSRAEKSEE